MITGNDEKVSFDENTGKTIHAPTRQGQQWCSAVFGRRLRIF